MGAMQIELENGEITERGWVFIRAGKPDSKELSDGWAQYLAWSQSFCRVVGKVHDILLSTGY